MTFESCGCMGTCRGDLDHVQPTVYTAEELEWFEQTDDLQAVTA